MKRTVRSLTLARLYMKIALACNASLLAWNAAQENYWWAASQVVAVALLIRFDWRLDQLEPDER
jgi:hypothetical protein